MLMLGRMLWMLVTFGENRRHQCVSESLATRLVGTYPVLEAVEVSVSTICVDRLISSLSSSASLSFVGGGGLTPVEGKEINGAIVASIEEVDKPLPVA